jgi:hypothetical protein
VRPKHSSFAVLIAVCLLAIANVAEAQDAETYRLRYEPTYRVGDRWRLVKSASQDLRRITKPAAGDERTQKFESRIELAGVCTARAVSDAGAWEELVIAIEKCEFHSRGDSQEILKPGVEVRVSVENGKRKYDLLDGSEFAADNQRLFGMVFGGPTAEETVSMAVVFALSQPRKVGEEWSCDKKLVIKALRGFAKDLTADDVHGTAKFEAVKAEDGRTRLAWTATMQASTKNPPVPRGGVPVRGSFKWSAEQTVPSEGDRGVWDEKIRAELRQVFKGGPESDDAETTFDGKSIQVYETKIEFLYDDG